MTMMMGGNVYLGIDPGSTGAIACVSDGSSWVIDMPAVKRDGKHLRVDPAGLATELRSVMADNKIAMALVESVHAMPKQGVSSSFAFGESFGAILGVLGALGIAHELVTPGKWKKDMAVGADKECSRARALALFPMVAGDLKRKKDHGRAEALLLAEVARRRGLATKG
jgi:hypothetical protein